MGSNIQADNIFILISLILLSVVSIMLIIQFIIWAITIIKFKKRKNKLINKSYETLLKNQGYQDVKIRKVRFALKFANYHIKKNCLKLSNRNFEEKTVWNIYQNLINISLIKLKKAKKKISIVLITSTIIFYLSAIATFTLSLIYYINLWNGTINKINGTAFSIISFIVLLLLVISWLVWTMTYEKLRKEIIELANKFNDPDLLKIIKRISNYKTLFPSSEWLF